MIAGTAPTTVTTSCNFSQPENPQITATVQRTGLPTFFARIWGSQASIVTTRAKAEAYNPSGQTVPIRVSVKPWLIPNCDPTTTPPCTGNPYFVDSTNNYQLPPNPLYIGQFLAPLSQRNAGTPAAAGQYYAIDLPQPTACPSPSAAPAGSCNQIGSSVYHDSIACADDAQLAQLTCGSTVTVDANNGQGQMKVTTKEGVQCLIHTAANGNPPNLCSPAPDSDPDCFVSAGGSPVVINGGLSNPNTAMRVSNISRSDSIVTVPIFDFQQATDDPCPAGTCGTATVMGFLQLGIQSVSNQGAIQAVVLNAAGCNPANSGPPVSGGAVSPIPVRLIQ
jgi:hypothetical protein